jgi:6-phosphogluconate dehydrogenase (decarboxylating)
VTRYKIRAKVVVIVDVPEDTSVDMIHAALKDCIRTGDFLIEGGVSINPARQERRTE